MTIHGHPLRLRHRVQVCTLGLLPDQQGGFTEIWQPLFKIWMHIKRELANVKAAGGTDHGLRRGTIDETGATFQGWARHRPALIKGMRVVDSDLRTYVILNSPIEEGNYQSFHLGLCQLADGGSR